MIALNETAGATNFTLAQIEPLCTNYDAECVKLEDMIAALEADLETVKQKHLRNLKRQASVVAAREAELHSAVESSPGIFTRPKTFVIAGTKIGMANTIGGVMFEDADQVVSLILKHRESRFDELVKTEYTPRKDALRTLSEKDLSLLGCRIEGAGEVVIVKRVAGDVEKLITKLIEKLVNAMVKKDEE